MKVKVPSVGMLLCMIAIFFIFFSLHMFITITNENSDYENRKSLAAELAQNHLTYLKELNSLEVALQTEINVSIDERGNYSAYGELLRSTTIITRENNCYEIGVSVSHPGRSGSRTVTVQSIEKTSQPVRLAEN